MNPLAAHAVAPPWLILPFVVLLGAIAVMPLAAPRWWNRFYPAVAGGLASVTGLFYFAVLRDPLRLLNAGIEYAGFITLIGSLFVVSGGIHIRIKGKSSPALNVLLLAIGAAAANVVGTTGASMILIRPYLRANKYRIRPYHVVFFILIVSNLGGALTPIGDPPLFLGYLRGVPFFWVAEHLWPAWIIGVGSVLAIFWVIETLAWRKLPAAVRHAAEHEEETGEVSGGQNVVFLCLILAAVFVTDPPLVREAIMILAAAGSYLTTKREIHRKNGFNFHPIAEVAILFAGIFITMVPALDWLEANAGEIGIHTPGQFFWATGALSSVLDNAPTYLNFLSASFGLLVDHETVARVQDMIVSHGAPAGGGLHAAEAQNTFATLQKYHGDLVASGTVTLSQIQVSFLIGNCNTYLRAISISAVFFGALTYIGNGPNFMVKSIAEQSGAESPSFFGYIFKYALPVLLPVFIVLWLLFFNGSG